MSMFRNVMVYLGLGPDEEYDDSYLLDDGEGYDDLSFDDDTAMAGAGAVVAGGAALTAATAGGDRAPGGGGGPASQPTSVGTVGSVRPIRPTAVDDSAGITVRPISGGDDRAVRPVAKQAAKPRAISPQSFGDAKIIGDEFKRGVPIVMNLQTIDRDLARRLIDFASGVCYVLGGSMDKLASSVFLLTPKGVEVSDDDRRRIEERGFDL